MREVISERRPRPAGVSPRHHAAGCGPNGQRRSGASADREARRKALPWSATQAFGPAGTRGPGAQQQAELIARSVTAGLALLEMVASARERQRARASRAQLRAGADRGARAHGWSSRLSRLIIRRLIWARSSSVRARPARRWRRRTRFDTRRGRLAPTSRRGRGGSANDSLAHAKGLSRASKRPGRGRRRSPTTRTTRPHSPNAG